VPPKTKKERERCFAYLEGWLLGDECEGRRGRLVTGWRRMTEEGEGWGKRVGEKGQNELLERGAMGFSTEEGWRVKGVRVGMKG
jgi:hypothetical protein